MPTSFKEYYRRNRARILAKTADYRRRNRTTILQKKRSMAKATYPKRRAKLGIIPRADYLQRIAVPTEQKRMRRRIYDLVFRALHTARTDRTIKALGCSSSQFSAHLQASWTANMSWDNYGQLWEVDHITPLSSFDLSDPPQFSMACHFSNTRARLASENHLAQPKKNFPPPPSSNTQTVTPSPHQSRQN